MRRQAAVWTFAALCAAQIVPGAAVFAQERASGPLSVIDWLDAQPAPAVPAAQPAPPRDEPPVATSAQVPNVSVQSLDTEAARNIGLVPANVTGLPGRLWRGSDPARLTSILNALPDLQLPAAQALLFTVLLSEAEAPAIAPQTDDQLALARVAKLIERGALDPALALLEQIGPRKSPAHFGLWMDLSLLSGQEDRACTILRDAPHLSDDYATRIFCAARLQDWETAALTLGSAEALGLIDEGKLALLIRFLDPETAEDLPPLTPPRTMDPLSFRLFETLGERLPTASLPRPYAVADLRDLAGWKAQIEAAERLARAGALSDNRLLGLYTMRRAAASGGVWDRVRAVQRFETALQTGSADAVAKTLPSLWDAMRAAQLEMPLAALFAEAISRYDLTGRAGDIALRLQLLSPGYESAAQQAEKYPLWQSIARGEATGRRPDAPLAAAVYDAFDGGAAPQRIVQMAQTDRLGEAILSLLRQLHEGANGSPGALRDALSGLRALGLEDSARQAALQVLLLERS